VNKKAIQVLKLIFLLAITFLLIEWFSCGFGFNNKNALQITINSFIAGISIGVLIVLAHLFYSSKKR